MTNFPSPFLVVIALVFTLFGTSGASAQSISEKSQNSFTCLHFNDLAVTDLFYKKGSEYLPIDLGKGKRSKSYTLGSSKIFELYVLGENEEGEVAYNLVGSAPLVAGAKQMLFVVFNSREKSPLPLKILGLDDTLKGFPPGSFRFVNFTSKLLLVKVRDKVSQLEAGKITVVDSESSQDGGMIPVTYGNAQREKIHFTRLYAHSRSREVIFIAESTNPKRKLSFTFLPQNVPSPPK